MTYDAESPKAYATKLYNEVSTCPHQHVGNVAKIAQALREWEARGLEAYAIQLDGLANPITGAVRHDLLVRAKELRGKSLDNS